MDTARLFQKKGFTLIELLIVLAVTVIIAGGLFWSFRASDRMALQQASYALQADFRYAQRMALIEGRRWGIVFDVLENQYEVISTDPTVVEKTVPLPNDVQLIETSDVVMLYLPRGTGWQGFRVTLAKGRYWQRLTATVSGGRVAIKDIITTQDGEIPNEDE